MSRTKASTSGSRRPAVRCDGSGEKPETIHRGTGLGLCNGCQRIIPVKKGSLARHFIPRKRYSPDLRPAIAGGAVDVETGVSYQEFCDAWQRASARITERHKKLTYRQKRGGRKGARTQQIRHDYLRLATEGRIRVDEIFPRSWQERIRGLVRLAGCDRRVDLVIANPVLVGLKAPGGGQDNGPAQPVSVRVVDLRCARCGIRARAASSPGKYDFIAVDPCARCGAMLCGDCYNCHPWNGFPCRPAPSGGAVDAPRGHGQRCERCGEPAPPIHGKPSLLGRLTGLAGGNRDHADVDIPVHGTGLVLKTRFCGACIQGAGSSKTLEQYVAQIIRKRLKAAGVDAPESARDEQLFDVIRQPRPGTAPSGGQDGLEAPKWIPKPENPLLLMQNITIPRLPNRWFTQRTMLRGPGYDHIRQFADGAMDAFALCATDVRHALGIPGVLKTDVGLLDREQSVFMPVDVALQLWAEGVDATAHLIDGLDRQSQIELAGNETLRVEVKLHLSGRPEPRIRLVDPAVEFVLRWRRQAAGNRWFTEGVA